jgi:hypothetical protein
MHAFNITSPLTTPFFAGPNGEEVARVVVSANGTKYRLTDSSEINPTPNGEEFVVCTRMVDELDHTGTPDLQGAWVMSMPTYGIGDVVLEWDEFYMEG